MNSSRDGEERCGIVRLHLIEERAQHARKHECAGQSRGNATGDEPESVEQDEIANVAVRSAPTAVRMAISCRREATESESTP